MLKRAVVVVLIAFGASRASSQQMDPSSGAALDAIRGSVVLVRAIDAEGATILGNGVVIGTLGQIVTERAILEGAAIVTVLSSGNALPVTATIVRVDTVTGIAVLLAPGLEAKPAPVARRSLTTNDPVIVVTVGEDQPPALRRGTVRTVEAFVGTEIATLSATIALEANGAPVTNLVGEVVGIAFSSVVDGAERTFSIPARAFAHLAGVAEARQRPTSVAVTPQARPASANSPAPSKARSAPPSAATQRGATQFSAAGLEFEQTIMAIYAGQFQNVDIKREEMTFRMLLSEYINACSRLCEAYLPANKVELMTEVCVREKRMVNGYGVPVGSPSCVEWVPRGTGRYADPAMVEARRRIRTQNAGTSFGDAMRMTAAGNMIGTIQKIRSDVNELLQRNGCASPGTKRFQENLRLFALRQEPIELAGAEAAAISGAAKPLLGSNVVTADFTKLLDDLIADQATSWMMHRYSPGSVTKVSVTERDAQGRPLKVEGSYLFSGRYVGSVVVQFSNGIPECMFFHDMPQSCRTPSRKISASYANGGYPPP